MAYEFAGAYDAAALDTNSQLLKSVAFELVTEPGGVPATLYTDRLRSAVVPQPFLSDAEGNVHLFTDPGRYRLRQAGSPPGEEITVQPDPDESETELEAHTSLGLPTHGGGGVSDHGALTGLADDDHPQYLTTAEGNAAYAPISEPVAGAHIADPTDAHDASAVSNVPSGTVAATDVQAAINELDTEKLSGASHDARDHSVPAGTVVLDDLQNVAVPGPALNDVLTFDGANWINAVGGAGLSPAAHDARDHSVPAGTVALFDLEDVDALAPTAPLVFLARDPITLDWGPSTIASIPGAVPTGTAGSIAFWNASGTTITEDNPNLFYDDPNNRVHIGPRGGSPTTATLNVYPTGAAVVGQIIRGSVAQTADLTQRLNSAGTVIYRGDAAGRVHIGDAEGAVNTNHDLTVYGSSFGAGMLLRSEGGASFFQADIYNNGIDGGTIFHRRARGTRLVPLAAIAGDALMSISNQGHDGVAFANGGKFSWNAAETWSAAAHGTYRVATQTLIGTTALTFVEGIDGDGRFQVLHNVSGLQASLDGKFNVEVPATMVGSVIKLDAAATLDAFQVRDSASTVLSSIDSGGFHKWVAAKQQATVGLFGAAAPPPATPARWLQVKDSTGATLVLPAYNP